MLLVAALIVLASCGDDGAQSANPDASQCVFAAPSQQLSSIDDLRLEVERQLRETNYSWTISIEADRLIVELPLNCQDFGNDLKAYAKDRVVVTELPGEIRPL